MAVHSDAALDAGWLQAESLVLSLRDLFQLAFETKKKKNKNKEESELATSSDAGGDDVDAETGAKCETGDERSTEVSQ